MANPWAIATGTPPPSHRGGGVYDPTESTLQAGQITWSWGASPASGTMRYVSAATPFTVGSTIALQIFGHQFFGVCQYDEPVTSSKGHSRELRFVDNREYLTWDKVFGCFNIPDHKLVNGVRVKRWHHIYPEDYPTLTKTYTNAPLTAAQIINALLVAPTTEDPWTCEFHVDQNTPLSRQFDFLSGESLASALTNVAEAQGLVFTLMGGPFHLVFGRKGTGVLPVFPAASDDRVNGLALSGNPTRIRVLGDRNLYQVHDIPMVPDWKRAWEAFYDPILFVNHIYNIGFTKTAVTVGGNTFPAGTAFATIGASPQDPEQMVARQLARACAYDMTVSEFQALVDANPPPPGYDTDFIDTRKFANRSRADMPCVLYIARILFRAFKFPSDFSLLNADGNGVSLDSTEIHDRMLAKVTHDPLTGVMEYDYTENAEGNGYAIVKGYQVGHDLFKSIRPERFNLQAWNDAQDVWEHMEFQVDDSGEVDGRYILFDEPVIRSSDLVTMVDGYGVLNATPTFNIPEVKVALTFEGERFFYTWGTGTKDDVEGVPGLHGEYTSSYANQAGTIAELPYADGLTANQKANAFAVSLLNGQFVYNKGSYTRWLLPNAEGNYVNPTLLTGQIDRVELNWGPDGFSERVELCSERPRQVFTPERDLDRNEMAKTLLPGQQELRHMSNWARLTAAALNTSPEARKTASDAFNNLIGNGPPTVQTVVAGDGVAAAVLPVGSIIRKEPTVKGVPNTKTMAVLPAVAGAAHAEFVGVTYQDNATVGANGGQLAVCRDGDILALVHGPISFGKTVGLVDGENYLGSTSDTAKLVGRAMEVIATATTKLIKVRVGGGGGGTGMTFKGEWAAGVSYAIDDVVVVRSGVSAGTYVCVLATTPAQGEPMDPAQDPSLGVYWVQLASGNTMGAWT